MFDEPPKQLDVRANYKKIISEFCKHYYETINNSGFAGLQGLYRPNAYITFLEDESEGYEIFMQKLYNLRIRKMGYNNVTFVGQPVGDKSLIINVTGNCCTYNFNGVQTQWCRFSETIILSRDNNNRFFICQSIFKLST